MYMEIEMWRPGVAGQVITEVRKFLKGNPMDQEPSTFESSSEPEPVQPTNNAGLFPEDGPQDFEADDDSQ
jgi:hypothetical protein